MKVTYLESIMAVERLHHLFFEMIKSELDRLKIMDINNMQCFILYNIGPSQMSVGEISNRGYYMGSNVTYNLKKLVEYGYVIQVPSPHDKRSSQISLSPKGLDLFNRLDKIFTQHSVNLTLNNITKEELTEATRVLTKVESFWRFNMSHNIIT